MKQHNDFENCAPGEYHRKNHTLPPSRIMAQRPSKRLTPEQEQRLAQCQLVASMLWNRLGGEIITTLDSEAATPHALRMRTMLMRALLTLPPSQVENVKKMAGPFVAKNQLLIDLGRDPALQNVASAAHDIHGTFIAHLPKCKGGVPVTLRPFTDEERTKTLDEAIAWCMGHQYELGDDVPSDDEYD